MTPPLAFTHAKYAASMLEMSVKSVPGCLVLIAPSTIGVPVAAVPALGPHDEVSTEPDDPLLVDVADDEPPLLPELPAALLELLLLLPQPAMTAAPTNAARTRPTREREQRIDDQRNRMETSVSSRPAETGGAHPTAHRYLLSRSCTKLLAISQPIANIRFAEPAGRRSGVRRGER